MLHKLTNTHTNNRLSTVTYLKDIWEWEQAHIRPPTKNFNNVEGIEDTASSLIITQQELSPPLCM